MEKIKHWITENIALSITSANVILLLVLFINKDPFDLLVRTYEKSPSFFKIDEQNITKILIKRQGDEISQKELLKESLGWKLQFKGRKFIAEEDRTKQFIKAILGAKKFNIVSSSKEKSKEFGTEGIDAFEIQVYNSKESLGKLIIGNTITGGNGTNVRWNDGDDIFLVEENLKSFFGRGEDDFFINKKFTPSTVSSSNLNSVKLVSGNEVKYLLNRNGENWELSLPKKLSIAKEKLNDLLNKIISLNADEVIYEENKLPALTSINFELELKYKKETDLIENTVMLKFIGKDEKSKSYYLSSIPEQVLYRLNEYQVKEILNFDLKKLE
ncbi:MAG: DUF4340 domain-containing protein [Leptospiraceae bacterium]|nr:DUF4340 domain-containing protein [Leptospiraceae bacterium]